MPAVPPLPSRDIILLPVVHGRVEVAAWVRSALDAVEPAGVAVELPTTFEDAAQIAVSRLPRITLVVAPEADSADGTSSGASSGPPSGESAVVWTAAPGDPFAEALRWAAERGRERFLVDPDIPYAERTDDPVPDPYALLELGPDRYFGLLLEALAEAPASEADRRREAGMAHHLKEACARLDRLASSGEAPDGPLVAVVGAAHVARLAEAIRGPTATPFARVGARAGGRVEVRHVHPDSLTALLPDPPLAHAAWELLRSGPVPPEDETPDAIRDVPIEDATTGPVSITRAGLTLVRRAAGTDREADDPERRAKTLATLAARRGSRPVRSDDGGDGWPGGLASGARGTKGAGRAGEGPPRDLLVPDRRALARLAWEVGARSYARQTREETARWQQRIFFDYLNRLARTGGGLAAGLYEWVVAARGVADDNLAWEVFDAARAYPWQEAAPGDLPTARVDGTDLLLPEEWGTRTVRFRRRHFRVKRRPVPIRARPTPVDADDWADWLDGFRGGGLCSYPPEDLVIEDYGRFLRARAVGVLSVERTKTEPFASSLLDGIDVRETLRHVDDPRVWVRERGRAPGRAGSVVVIFDRDRPAQAGEGTWTPRYPYLMTWLGEHGDESDMAFYSTHPAEQVVGPGIMRATYGGFLMTVPPGRLFDVWRDPEYRKLDEKADRLVAAGVDYSRERLVVHVAERPPRAALRRYAASRGKQIVHVPLGSLGPRTLRKIRVLHILVGHDKREIARDYIW